MIRTRHFHMQRLLLICTMLAFSWQVGCSCKPAKPRAASKTTSSKTIEEMEAQRKKLDALRDEKPDFEIIDLQVMPSDEPAEQDEAKPQSYVKPGHWFGAVQRMKANNFDFPKGDLEAECVDQKVQSVQLPGDFELRTTRSVSLPKGQQKNTDLVLFAPNNDGKKFFFMSRLLPRGGGRQLDWKSELASLMQAQEYHFVVLADRADNYQFLKNMRIVNPRDTDSAMFITPRVDYRIKLPKGTQRVDLSSHPLTWSTVAYLIWDDFDPDILTIGQQEALLDWLHWGGQLVVNGPGTLDRLSASFLGEYLPARATTTEKITDLEIAALNTHWSFENSDESEEETSDDAKETEPPKVNPARQIARTLRMTGDDIRPLCVRLKLVNGGSFVDKTSQLIAQRRVGRGSIRVTAFNLPHPTFRQWAGYDGLVNACLLARPARRFFVSGDQGVVAESWQERSLNRKDPRITSKVRYFSRDATSAAGRRFAMRRARELRKQTATDKDNAPEASGETAKTNDRQSVAEASPPTPTVHRLPRTAQLAQGITGFSQDPVLGVAGWNDRSDVSRIATRALQEAAGVEVPPADFVAKVLGIYLLILVPVNWLLFRIIGRVEWAWAVIPLLAIGGAIAVVRATQLDIGFVRSRTEIAVLELQPGYDRAHLTRYIGFYTSLASPYEITGENEASLLLPLDSDQRTTREVGLQFGDTVKMTGLNVMSNSTGMIHAEQMLNVGGAIELVDSAEDAQIVNGTNLDLRGVVVVRRTSETEVEFDSIGKLARQASYRPEFQPLTTGNLEIEQWVPRPVTDAGKAKHELDVRGLLELAAAPERLDIGATVLVGWSEDLVPGVEVKPRASQILARTVVVAQLAHAAPPAPQRDANSYFAQKQIATQRKQEAENQPLGSY